jgi:hypothetical protein
MDPDVRKWRRKALLANWRIRHSGAHERWYSPDRQTIVTVSSTHLSAASVRNIQAKLRRGGLAI